jgi:peptidoglycan/xylan/chitin deacetylase (PgdA/CDA1 family)
VSSRRLALKVDCDTFEGTQKGIPNLLRLFDEFKICASFFFTLGPDTSGRAAFRIFTQKGFLKKMLRSNAAALYGPRTMLYGTLLPSPMIGKKLADTIRSVGNAGHDIGVHGWDHIRWHDKVDRMSPEAIERDVSRAHETFENIFGKKAHSSAAPGWHACRGSLEAQERRNLLYASDTRGGSPCFIEADGERFNTLEIPSTLPTWDEMLGDPSLPDNNAFIRYFTDAIKATEVHSIHTEVEATAHADLFRKQMESWKAAGVGFVTLEEIANEQLADRKNIPIRRLKRIEIPNRAGKVSSCNPSF